MYNAQLKLIIVNRYYLIYYVAKQSANGENKNKKELVQIQSMKKSVIILKIAPKTQLTNVDYHSYGATTYVKNCKKKN